MNPKNIFLEPDEEIISVVDRLAQAQDNQINLVVPLGAQIWQSSINLKLLKREADNMSKEVTLIVSDDLGKEMAERTGFIVKKEKDFLIEKEIDDQDQEKIELSKKVSKSLLENNKDNMIGILVDELKPGNRLNSSLASSVPDFEEKAEKPVKSKSFFSEKKGFRFPSFSAKNKRQKMADIVNPIDNSKINLFRQKITGKKPSFDQILRPKEKESVIIEKKPTKSIKIKEINISGDSVSLKWPKVIIGFIGLTFLTVLAVGYLVLPSTEVVIFPKKEEVSIDLSIIGSKTISQIDESLNKIPMQEVTVRKTESREFSATGEKKLDRKARGFLTIYNEYSSAPQTLVATTRFESSEGKVFRISGNITVPGAEISEGKIIPSSVRIEVIADQSGEEYNIGPSDFTIPGFKGTAKYAGFYAKSDTAMTEGSIKNVKVVSSEDLERVENELAEDLKEQVMEELKRQIPTDLKIVEGGLKEDVKTISGAEQGTETDKFTVEMEASIQTLLFKEDDLMNLIDLNLIAGISEDKIPLSDTQQIDWNETEINWLEKEAFFSLRIKEQVAWKIDIQKLKNDLAGKKEVEARKYLSEHSAIEGAKVSFWPFWVKKIPAQEKKIKIEVEY